MGIDYSTEIGYGIAIAEDELPETLKPLAENPYEDGEIPDWLEENGFDKLGYTYSGDWMSGTCYLFFYAPDTFLRNDAMESETLVDFAHNDIDTSVMQQLRELAKVLDYPRFDIGWKLINNVS